MIKWMKFQNEGYELLNTATRNLTLNIEALSNLQVNILKRPEGKISFHKYFLTPK